MAAAQLMRMAQTWDAAQKALREFFQAGVKRYLMANQIIFADNLGFLKAYPPESVALIYIDPPFNTGRTQARTRRAGWGWNEAVGALDRVAPPVDQHVAAVVSGDDRPVGVDEPDLDAGGSPVRLALDAAELDLDIGPDAGLHRDGTSLAGHRAPWYGRVGTLERARRMGAYSKNAWGLAAYVLDLVTPRWRS